MLTTSGAQVVTMSSESEGDERCSNGGNGSHFEPPSHHVTPITPYYKTQVAPDMMMGQTNVSMTSMEMPQSTVQTAVPQMFPVFPVNPGALPQGSLVPSLFFACGGDKYSGQSPIPFSFRAV